MSAARIAVLAAFLLGFALVSPAADPPAAPKTPAELVALLGDRSFRVREAASRDLLRLREKSLDALKAGLESPDAEVVQRCTRLLPLAQDAATAFYLAQFAKDPASVDAKNLPALTRWVEVVGKSDDSLAMYRAVVQSSPRTLDRWRSIPARLPDLYAELTAELRSRPAPAVAETGPGADADLHLLLFLGSQRETPERFGVPGLTPAYYVFNQWSALKELLEPADSPTRKLLVAWLDKEDNSTLFRRVLTTAANAKVEEVIPVAARRAHETGAPPSQRGMILATLGQFAAPKRLPALEPLLGNATVVRPAVKGNGAVDSEEIQIRDIALGLAVLWSGQDPKDYHFDKLTREATARNYTLYTIKADKRDEAFGSWAKWQADRPKGK